MGTQIFLGKPQPSVVEWIRKRRARPETHIKFVDGTEDDYLIEGAMDCPALIAAGLMPPGSGTEQEPSWIKQPLEVNIGSAVTTVGSYAFYNCNSLTSVMMPNRITSIGNWAFYTCRGLTSVMIPDNVTSIGDHAFYHCDGLTNVVIPAAITIIGDWAFAWCTGLTSATILSSVTSIGNDAFSYCNSLMSVTFSEKTKSTVQGMSNYSWKLPSGCVIHCTDGDITI